jgi:hypothetical protein
MPGESELKVLEDAPGSYAMLRLGTKPWEQERST